MTDEQWATCTKKSRDKMKQLGKNEVQKWNEHIKICSFYYTTQQNNKMNENGEISYDWFVGSGKVSQPKRFSERFLRKNGI